MLTNQSTEKQVATENQSGEITLRLSYTEESAHMVGKAVCFVFNKMGYAPMAELTNEGLIAVNKEGEKLILSAQLHTSGGKINKITFHTDDCLRDYHKYIISGVEFINRPEYTSSGLEVSFIDDEDNLYTLLEDRIYTEY